MGRTETINTKPYQTYVSEFISAKDSSSVYNKVRPIAMSMNI